MTKPLGAQRSGRFRSSDLLPKNSSGISHTLAAAAFFERQAKIAWVQFEIPAGDEEGAFYRALIIVDGAIYQITDALVGTTLKPLVLYEGQVKQRSEDEGFPLVLIDGQLCTLPVGGTLKI